MGLILHVDGGSRGNPGPAGAGVVIVSDTGRALFEAGFFLGEQTNNAAEYLALIHGLRRAQAEPPQPLTIRADSELIVRQITGQYRVKSPGLQKLYEQAQLLLLRVPLWKIEHVPREANARADELANLAMDRGGDVIVLDAAGAKADAGPENAGGAAGGAKPRPAPGPASGAAPAGAAPGGPPLRVYVAAQRRQAADVCPAGDWASASFVVDATLPAGVCVHAAHALLPTILAVQGTASAERGGIPAMTVRCNRPECGAVFQVTAQPPSNGRH